MSAWSVRWLAAAVGMLALAAGARAQQVVIHPRVFNDVPDSTYSGSTGQGSVTLSDQNVSAPSGNANRHDWRLSADGVTDRTFGPGDSFILSADVTLTGSPTSPRKEAGLRINGGACGDALLTVNTDAHEVVAFGGVFPFYDFRAHGAPDYQSGDTVHMSIRYLRQDGVNGFYLSVGGVTSPFLPAQGPSGGLCPGSTVGGYLQVNNAPAVPANAGAASFTNIAALFDETSPPVLTDAELLDRTEAQACAYASGEVIRTDPAPGFPNGRMMIRDTTRSGNLSSVAATGMGLVCLAIEAYRYGTSPEWTVTPETARSEASTILDTVLEMQGNSAASWNGVPYHFVQPDASGRFVRAPGSEVSSVDGALLMTGVLAAGQYFGGDVRDKALQVFQNTKWSLFLVNPDNPRFSMAWRPESGGGYSIARLGGYLTTATWDRPTDEVLAVGIVGLGREPDQAYILRAMYSWPRDTRTYLGGNGVAYHVVNSYFGSLFTYTQLHALVPFDALGPDHPEDVGASVPAVNWWTNSVTAALASRQFSIDHAPGKNPPDGYPTHAAFGPDSWGLTAAFNPVNLGDYVGNLGAPPREANGGAPEPQGIIAPYGAISAMRLLRTSPNEALSDNPAFRALRHYYDAMYATLWGPYGPKESFDDAGNVADLYVGIDVPLEAMAIEDYRSGAAHRWFTSSPPVADALRILFHAAILPGDVTLDGTVDLQDVRAALRIAGGLQRSWPAEVAAGDLDGDGRITMSDAVAIARTAG